MRVVLTMTAQEARDLRDAFLASEEPTIQAYGFQMRRQVEAHERRIDWNKTGVPYPPPRRPLRPFGKKAKKDRAEMDKARRVVTERSNGRCEVAGCPLPADHLHHRRTRSQGGTNDPDNLMHVCSTHHRMIHDMPEWAYKKGFLFRVYARWPEKAE